jgi:hypothetical protein
MRSRLQLRSPREFSGQSASIRRPGFLAGLEESKYHQAFENLTECPKPITTHIRFNAHIKDVGLSLAAICEHVYYWLDPIFVKPASSEPDKLPRLDWMKMLAWKLWAPVLEANISIQDVQATRAEQRAQTMKLVLALARFIEEEADPWKEEVSISLAYKQFVYALTLLVQAASGGLTLNYEHLVNVPVDDDIQADYVTRFHRHSWNQVLCVVLDHIDRKQLTGLMAQFGTNLSVNGRTYIRAKDSANA